MLRIILFALFIAHCHVFSASPFAIELPREFNKELKTEDYIELQKQVRKIDINNLITEKYQNECKDRKFADCGDFYARCSKGIRQSLVDIENGFIPKRVLVKIGNGGDRCVVCCAPFNGKYPYYVQSLLEGLKTSGFNGHYLYYFGGWPNPTGKEITYTAVPYSFKIFAMIDAQLLGFNTVLWVDSACYPLRNIDPLFEIIEQNGALLNWRNCPSDYWRYIFPSTRNLLSQLTGVDVLKAKYVNSIVMGLKMDTPEAKRFIQKYYDFVAMGTPFLSCFPEEFVFTSIINDGTYPAWLKDKPHKLVTGSVTAPEKLKSRHKKGPFFYQRKGR